MVPRGDPTDKEEEGVLITSTNIYLLNVLSLIRALSTKSHSLKITSPLYSQLFLTMANAL